MLDAGELTPQFRTLSESPVPHRGTEMEVENRAAWEGEFRSRGGAPEAEWFGRMMPLGESGSPESYSIDEIRPDSTRCRIIASSSGVRDTSSHDLLSGHSKIDIVRWGSAGSCYRTSRFARSLIRSRRLGPA